MSCSFSSPSIVEFQEVTPFKNKQICLNNSKNLVIELQVSTGNGSG